MSNVYDELMHVKILIVTGVLNSHMSLKPELIADPQL